MARLDLTGSIFFGTISPVPFGRGLAATYFWVADKGLTVSDQQTVYSPTGR